MSTVQILLHMNKDHKTSLHDYLEYYGGVHVDLDSADKVELADVKLNEITIDYTKGGVSKSVVIPLSPPMSNMGDARERFIRMAFEAARGLHVSPYRITRFAWPTTPGGHAQLWGWCVGVGAFGIAAFSQQVLARLDVLRHARLLRTVFVGTVAVHAFEFLRFVLPILRRFRAPTSLYVKYLLVTLLGGYAAWLPLKREQVRLDIKASQ